MSGPGRRGEVWWADFGRPVGSEPAHQRPVLVVSGDEYNESRMETVIVAAITSNLTRASLPGNVSLPKGAGRLPKRSVVNLAHVRVISRQRFLERLGVLDADRMAAVDDGLRFVLGLPD